MVKWMITSNNENSIDCVDSLYMILNFVNWL